jgi:hypothetical protein
VSQLVVQVFLDNQEDEETFALRGTESRKKD